LRQDFLDLRTTTHVTLLAEELVRNVDEQIKDYATLVHVDDPENRQLLSHAQRAGDAVLKMWDSGLQHLPDSPAVEAQRAKLRHMEDQYAQLERVGDRILGLLADRKRDEAARLVRSEIDSLTQGSLRAAITRFMNDEETH